MLKVRVTDIDWDADEGIDLPLNVEIELEGFDPLDFPEEYTDEEYTDYLWAIENDILENLAETYGFCVEGFDYEVEGGLNNE